MKKTLLAAALLTGGFTGAAVAANSVTLYGRISVGYAYSGVKLPSDNAAINERNIQTGTRNQFAFESGYAPGASLWGLRGVEDLGNGLRASFQFEGSVAATTGAFSGFDRIAALRLSSDSWGTVGLGRDVNAAGNMTAGVDPFGAAWGYAGADDSMGIFGGRNSNMIQYTTPSISGFQGAISYSSAGNEAFAIDPDSEAEGVAVREASFGTTNKNRFLSVGLRYANGPVLLSAAYNQTNLANNAGNTTPKVWLVGGTYDLQVVKLHGAFGQSIDGLVGNAKILGTNSSGGSVLGLNGVFGDGASGILAIKGSRSNNWMIGASAPVGDAGRFLISFQQQIPGGLFKEEGWLATQSIVGVGYTYNLSNRTSLYASYNYANNLYMLSGVKAYQVAVGVLHNF